ncbi:nucleotidyltransferase domain-containing protein [Thermoproteota archaeon]
MRLTQKEISSIKDSVFAYDSHAKIYLFGSRAEDSLKGGDIDLLIESSKIGPNERRKIKINLYDKIGEQKIDIILSNEKDKTFISIAKQTGILL